MGVFQSKIRSPTVSPESTDGSEIENSKNEKRSKNKRNNVINNHAILKQEGYDLFETIGFGAYAIVKHGYCRKREKNIAVKLVDQNRVPKQVKNKFLPRELRIAVLAKHDNIVQCFEVITADSMIYMILEMIENGDLLSYVVKNDFVQEDKARRMFMGITAAVKYLHDNNIVHRDIKLENILLDKNLVPKLSDFGFARDSDSDSDSKLCRTYCGSAAYAPLEILLGIPYDPYKVDIWCLGVILYAMTVGYMPFSDEKRKKDIKKGVSYRDTKQPITKQLRELITYILVINANARPTILEILAQEWLQVEARRPC